MMNVGFDQLPGRWVECGCDAPPGLGATPVMHRGSWHALSGSRVLRFQIGAGSAVLPGDSAVIAAANALLAYYDNNAPTTASITTVSAFQSAYNASGQPGVLTVDGQYGPNTQRALQNVIDSAEAGLGPTQGAPANAWGTAPPATPAPDVAPAVPATPNGPGTYVAPTITVVGTPPTNYTPWIIGGVAAAGVGLVGYTYWKKHRRGHRS
jgi:hypothetical protein